ncbi:YihY/virulence factor BrkB family protein [Yinghuangia sp. ASG 101]|uniref:YhjD/YihY/BrkB family envelope integrity protein n=1 Tax=Yinghuangia sp. ASG 101 TaxID=2896848 RepID=UPI001E416C96|nr:YhjD/YihY/BrkB family envelope integrity protein [Yinghuangia sp. ASG 101]UGQ12611.1 YihY/virulence factor BrkB family protein [Yinghuangia sp. ASG 101]
MADAEAAKPWRTRAVRLYTALKGGFVGRCTARAFEIQITDRMLALAAQAFLALLPLVIVVAAAAPDSVTDGLVDVLRKHVGLSGGSTTQNIEVIAEATDEAGVTVVGSLLVLLAATSFSRALQRVYERAWRLPPGGLRSAWRPLAWIIGVLVYFVVLALTFKVSLGGVPWTLTRSLITAAGSLVLWSWTPFVLLSGRVRWRALWPTALATSCGTVLLGAFSAEYVPHLLTTNERRYGTLGVAFAIESWLVVLFAVVVAATVVGTVLVETPGRVGVWARGTPMPEGWRRIPRREARARGGRSRNTGDKPGGDGGGDDDGIRPT